MKFETINYIHKMLVQKDIQLRMIYKNVKKEMEGKYKTEWIDSNMTEEDREHYYHARNIALEIREVLNEFQEHDW